MVVPYKINNKTGYNFNDTRSSGEINVPQVTSSTKSSQVHVHEVKINVMRQGDKMAAIEINETRTLCCCSVFDLLANATAKSGHQGPTSASKQKIILTPSLRRPCIHAIFFSTACRTACKHAFCFLRVMPEAVSTRHSWSCDKRWMTCIHAGVSRSPREHASVPPDKRHCRQGMSEWNGMSEWIFA